MGCCESREAAAPMTASAHSRTSDRRSAPVPGIPASDPSPTFSPLAGTLEVPAHDRGATRPAGLSGETHAQLDLPTFNAPVTGLPRDFPGRRGRDRASTSRDRATASPRQSLSPPRNPLAPPLPLPRPSGQQRQPQEQQGGERQQQITGAAMSMDSTPIDQWLDDVAYSQSFTLPRVDPAPVVGSPSSSSMVLTMRRSASQKLQAALRREMSTSASRP